MAETCTKVPYIPDQTDPVLGSYKNSSIVILLFAASILDSKKNRSVRAQGPMLLLCYRISDAIKAHTAQSRTVRLHPSIQPNYTGRLPLGHHQLKLREPKKNEQKTRCAATEALFPKTRFFLQNKTCRAQTIEHTRTENKVHGNDGSTAPLKQKTKE